MFSFPASMCMCVYPHTHECISGYTCVHMKTRGQPPELFLRMLSSLCSERGSIPGLELTDWRLAGQRVPGSPPLCFPGAGITHGDTKPGLSSVGSRNGTWFLVKEKHFIERTISPGFCFISCWKFHGTLWIATLVWRYFPPCFLWDM